MVVVPSDRVPSASAFREAIRRHARYSLAQPWETLSTRQIFECVSLAVRDIMVDRLLESEQRYRQADAKHLYYLSIEYLPGRYLANNLINLGLYDLCRETLAQMGVDLASGGGERARPRSRQWRAGAAGGLLPQLAGDARHAGIRLRDQLRVRPVPPGDRPRRSEGEAGQLARCPVALADRAAGGDLFRSCSWPDRAWR